MNIWRKSSRQALALCGLLALFTPVLARAGFGYALSFNGTNSYVSTPPINLSGSNAITLEAWIKPANLTNIASSYVTAQQANTNNPDWLLGFLNNGTILSFGLNTTAGYQYLSIPINASSYTDGNWHHLAATYDGTTKRIYVDGILVGSLAQFGNLAFTGTISKIGAGPLANDSAFFIGLIDDVRIWSVARSASDIVSNMFTPLTGAEPGLLAYYRFDEGAGSTTVDSSSNGRTGTLVNSPLWVPATEPTALPPLAFTGPVSNITSNSAALNGTAYARGIATTVHFDYGTTTNYGTQTPAQDIGNGPTVVSVSALIPGLSIGASYHYRLVAVGGGITNYGVDQVFSTVSPFGNALSFNGTDSFVWLFVINPGATTNFSLEAWIKPAQLTNTAYSEIMRQEVYTNNPDWLFSFQNNGTILSFGVKTSNGYQELHVPVNPLAFTDGSWHHVAATYDGTTERLYVDGLPVGSLAHTGNLAFTGVSSAIGANAFYETSEYFNGQIDEVRIWNVTRSAPEVINDLLTTLTGTEPGLLAYIPFDGGSGTSAFDSSPSGVMRAFIGGLQRVASTVPLTQSPTAFTGSASNITANSATLTGAAYTPGTATTIYFDYGATTNYGNQTAPQIIDNTVGGVMVSTSLSSLSPGSLYHYRIVGVGSAQTVFGTDKVFYTIGPIGGTALSFNGTNSYVSIPAIHPGAIGTFSLEAWIKPADITTTATSDIIRQGTSSSSADWLLGFQNHGTIFSFGLATSNSYVELHVPINPLTFVDGLWHHVAGTYDGTNEQLYVDGVLIGSAAQSGNIGSPSTSGQIGGGPLTPATTFFNGQIDEVRIWSVARNADDILNNAFTTLTSTEPGLLAYYRFDGAGTSATDYSPNGRTGALVNSPIWVPSTVPPIWLPMLLTGSVSGITSNSANLSGTVTPRGNTTMVYFDYGTTANYGVQTPIQDAGSTSGVVAVSASLSGLASISPYHYRLVAIGGGFTNFGADRFFFTIGPVGGTALSFNGSNSYVSIPAIRPSLSAFSVEAWIKALDITSLTTNAIFWQGNDFLIGFENNGSLLSFGLKTGNGYHDLRISINPSEFIGSWHHLAATYDGTTKRLYVDGILLGSATEASYLSFTATACVIGKSLKADYFNGYFNGQIDEVRTWSVARSAADINSNMFTCLSGTEPGLLAYYRFDEGAGATASSSTINSSNGTLIGGPLWVASTVPTAAIPFASTSFPANVTANSATLKGIAGPRGISTLVYFDYGATTGYGSQTPVQDIGNGSNGVSVSASVSGLPSGSACHYRLVAVGGGTTNFGGDHLFYTIGPVGGTALSFNGTNSYVSIPPFNPSPTNMLSVEAWIKPFSLTNAYYSPILAQKEIYGSMNFLAFENHGTILAFGLVTVGGYQELQIPINPSDFDGSWHHIAATYDGATKRVFVDGLLVGSAPQSGSLSFFQVYANRIGGDGLSSFFNGQIDEVRYWSVARSAADINNNRFTTLAGTEPGLLAYYRFDDGAGISAVDLSTNALAGTLMNNPIWVPSTVPTNSGPLAFTTSASNLTTITAVLNGMLYPRGIATTSYFDYGATTNYGSQTPLQDAGAGMGEVLTSTLISNLSSGSTYHFRQAAVGAGVTNFGQDAVLTTSLPINGTALSLDGVSAYVNIPLFIPSLTKTFSLEAWIKPLSLTNTTVSTILEQRNSSYSPDFLLAFQAYGTVLAFGLQTTNGYQEMHLPINPSALTDGNWHHLAATYDGASKRLYLDGVLVASSAQSGNLAFGGTASMIGSTPAQAWQNFNGQIDEVRIWSVTRSATDIACSMFNTPGSPHPGLVAYYQFNDGTGISAADSSGNGHTGTLQSTATWITSAVPTVLPPAPLTGSSSFQTTNSAAVSGTVFLRGSRATTWFVYGTDTNYGVQTISQDFAAGLAPVSMTASLSGLLPARQYHYRLVATNDTGTFLGPDRVFFTPGTGGGGAALSFNGSNNYVQSSPLYLGSGNTMTLEAWIKPVDITTTTSADILRQDAASGNPDWLLSFQTNGTILVFGLSTLGGAYLEIRVPVNPQDFTDGGWHHLAGTCDGTNMMLYVDGIQVGSTNKFGYISFNGTVGGIATSPNHGGEVFNGQIDEVRIWKVSRSATQINQLINRELTGAEPGLAAYYRFNEGSGNTTADFSTNRHNGSLQNHPAWVASTAPIIPFPPGLTGFSPAFGKQGTSVTLSGTNLLAITGVIFNGVSASFTTNSNFSITAIVPAGVTTGPITITNAANTFVTLTNFTVDTTAPSVTITSPTNATFVTSFSPLKAVATDDAGGSGVSSVNFSLQRQSDLGFWSGSAWGTSNSLPAALANGQWSTTSVLPSGTNLNNGAYTIYATSFDQVGNFASTQIGVTVDNSGSSPINSLANGNIQIRFAGIPGKTYRIQSSTDLSVWVDIGTVLVDSSGVLSFEDPNTASHSTRFYRTVTP
ncbi:MAG: hypothetical protein JWR26_4637 [Pedosphaera sp.]|nr:hypothetical protein [Pedosphaera sp.]